MANPTILVVESNLSVAQEIEAQLKALGYAVCASVQRGEQAIKTVPEVRPDLVLVDLNLEGEMKGDEVAEEIYYRFNIPVVYLIDSAEADSLEQGKISKVFGHVFQPLNIHQLRLSIEHCLYYHEKSLEYSEMEAQLNQTISELHARTQLMETVFDSMDEGIIVTDTAGNLLLSNQRAAQVFNVEVLTPDFIPSTWAEKGGLFEVDKETYLSTDRNPLLRARQGKPTDDMEVFVLNDFSPDGIYLNVNGRPLLNADNEVTAGVVIFRDTTKDKQSATALEQKVKELHNQTQRLEITEVELKQTVQELQEQQQLMETIFASVSDGIVVTNEGGEFLFINPSAERIVGMGETDTTPDEWSKTYGTFYPDKVTPFPSEELPLVHAMQGKMTDGVDLFIRNQGNPEGVFINVSGRPLQDKQDRVRGGVIVFRDVTIIKNTEAELEQTVKELQDQTQLMDTIFNSISDGVVVADEQGQFIKSNPAADHMTGQHLEELELNRASEQYGVFHPTKESLYPTDALPLVQAVNGVATDNVEMRVRNPALPEDVYLSVNGRPILDEKGTLRGGVAVARDITELKRTERELKATITQLQDQTQLMDTIFNSISDGVVVADSEGRYFMFNEAAKRMTGQNMQPIEMKNLVKQIGFFLPDKKTPFPDDQLPIARVLQGEIVNNVEMFLYNPATMQEGIHLSASARPLYDAQGTLTGGVSVSRDVTELKQAEGELRTIITQLENQTQLMDIIFYSISDGVLVCDETGNYIMVNPAAEHMVAPPISGLLDQTSDLYGLFQPDTNTLFPVEELPLSRALNGESTDNIEMRIHNPQLSEDMHVSINARPLRDAEGTLRGAVAVARDITELKKTENQLRESIAKLEHQTQLMQSTFDSISDGVVVADENGQFTMFNPSAEKIVGMGATDTTPDEWSEQYGLFFYDKVTPFPSAELPLTLALKGQATDNVEMFVRNPKVPDGVYISVNGRPLRSESGIEGGVAVFRDVTERLLAEEAKLAQAFAQGRLEIVEILLHNIGNSVNSVTVGIKVLHDNLADNRLVHRFSRFANMIKAHQGDWEDYIKNDPKGQQVLPFILALAEDFTAQNEQLVQTLERVRDRVSHIVDIIRTQRPSYQSSMTDMTEKNIHLRETILNALKLQQDSFDKREIQIEVNCEKAPQEIHIQESQFHQMLVNLFKNSIEAIDELLQSDGLNEAPHIKVKAYVSGDFLHLDVTDNGIGIEKEHFDRIFSTGYTTKKSGTGLGLHSIANFVVGAGGEIYPLSEGIGKGTTMRVKLLCSSVIPSNVEGSSAPGAGTG